MDADRCLRACYRTYIIKQTIDSTTATGNVHACIPTYT